MINKLYESAASAVADIFDGATVLIGGFGEEAFMGGEAIAQALGAATASGS